MDYVRNSKACLAAILVYLVTMPNILAVYPTPLKGVFVYFHQGQKMEILIFDFSNASCPYNVPAMKEDLEYKEFKSYINKFLD